MWKGTASGCDCQKKARLTGATSKAATARALLAAVFVEVLCRAIELDSYLEKFHKMLFLLLSCPPFVFLVYSSWPRTCEVSLLS